MTTTQSRNNLNDSDADYNRGDKEQLKDYYGVTSTIKAIEINPNDSEAYYNRGEHDEINDYYGAISDYTKAIEINPTTKCI